jgi:hypothetical protein
VVRVGTSKGSTTSLWLQYIRAIATGALQKERKKLSPSRRGIIFINDPLALLAQYTYICTLEIRYDVVTGMRSH